MRRPRPQVVDGPIEPSTLPATNGDILSLASVMGPLFGQLWDQGLGQ